MTTTQELQAKIAKLEKDNAALVAAQPKPREISIKISPTTGVISVSGLYGRFPVSMYRSCWKRLFTEDVAKSILTFIKVNDAEITQVMADNGKVDR